MAETPWFPFGGQYVPVAKAPEVPMSEWEKDIRQLKELGFTAFRAFVAWDRIEQEEGKRDYTTIDTALDLAERYGVKVLVNIGGVFASLSGIYPPQWLLTNYDCQQTIRDPQAPPDGPRPSGPRQHICLDDPIYRAKAADYLAETVAHIASHPALAGWVVWNEPENNPCYCPHTKARFREWLQARYPSLEALNEAWSQEFPVLYLSWEAVEPPSGVGFHHGGYQPWLEWRTFLQDGMAGAMHWVGQIVKENDPVGHPTSTNLTSGELCGHSVQKGVDPWKVGKILDIQGLSGYTQWGPPQPEPTQQAVVCTRLRSTSQAPGKAWWMVETEAGPMYWVHGSIPRYTRTPDRVLRYWQAIGHGAKAMYAWMYRSRIGNAQAGEFGMLAWDGSVTERAEKTAEISRTLNRHAELFLSRFPRAEVAILAAQSSDTLYRCETWEARPETFRDYWQRSWRGAYDMLWRARVPVDFIDDPQVTAEGLRPYRVLLVPFHLNLSEEVARGIEAFVRNGGTVIADFPFGFKTDGGVLWQRSPGAGLQPVFGAFANDAVPVTPEEDAITLGDTRFAPQDFWQELYPGPDTEVLGRWQGGGAALTSHRYGKGRALLAGTLFFLKGGAEDMAPREALLRQWLQEAGVRPVADLTPCEGTTAETAGKIEVCPLYPLGTEGEHLYIILNHNATPARVVADLPGCAVPGAGLRDLLTDAALAATQADGALRVELDLAAKGVIAFTAPPRA